MNDVMATIPLGYVCIPLEAYDDLQARLNSLKCDFHAELADSQQEIARLKAIIESRDDEISLLRVEMAKVEGRDKENAWQLLQAKDTIDDLKKELSHLYEELCRTDEIEEVQPHAQAERKEAAL